MIRVQTVTQKHYRVKNPGQKPNRLHEPPTGPASTPGAPRRARACPCCSQPSVVSWPGCPALSQPLGAVSQAPTAVSQPHAARPRAPSNACPLAQYALARSPSTPAPATRLRLACPAPSAQRPAPACCLHALRASCARPA